MDLSALIFVALAVAWAVYLIPKALKQHEESAARRSVDSFSDRLRVLARKASGDESGVSEDEAEAEAPVRRPLSPEALARVRRQAAADAARRRRRVLFAIVFVMVDTVALSYIGVLPWWTVGVSAGILVAWLVACRISHSRELSSPQVSTPVVQVDNDSAEAEEDAGDSEGAEDAPATAQAGATDPETEEIAVVPPPRLGWDPVPTTLPTYVGKAQAKRTVRTIALDSTGVFSAARNEADSELAREADEADRAKRAEDEGDEGRQASGS